MRIPETRLKEFHRGVRIPETSLNEEKETSENLQPHLLVKTSETFGRPRTEFVQLGEKLASPHASFTRPF
jgi:hypothetical protein